MAGTGESVREDKEVELKLELDPADTGRLASHPILASSPTPPEEAELVSTYFDTPDFALHRASVYLRVREKGGRFVQTIKAAGGAELIERFEWEQELPDRYPDLAAAAGTALEKLLTPELRAVIRPLFETRIRRTAYAIEQGSSLIEVAIDAGEIASLSGFVPVSEVELELKRGERAELFRLARALGQSVPLRVAVKTKAERGYALIAGGAPLVEKAADLHIPPAMPAAQAFRTIARSCLRQILANEPAMRLGYAEALHQMRIGLRRLRAGIALFAEVTAGEEQEKIKSELQWITRELGPARDLDVFGAEVLQPLQANAPEDPDTKAALRDFETKRLAVYASATASVRSARFRDALLDLAEWIELGAWTTDAGREQIRSRRAAKHAKEALTGLRKRIKAKGPDLREAGVYQRHRLRIRAKRLRYATEFFAATFEGEEAAKRRTESLSALKDLQDALGGLNDIATHRALVEDGADGEGGSRLSAQHLKHKEGDGERLLVEAERAYARFAGVKPFWKA